MTYIFSQVALKAKSSQVQTLCKQQTEQLEKDRLTIERYSREEAHLLRYSLCRRLHRCNFKVEANLACPHEKFKCCRRCEELETRNKELERDKAERDQVSTISSYTLGLSSSHTS